MPTATLAISVDCEVSGVVTKEPPWRCANPTARRLEVSVCAGRKTGLFSRTPQDGRPCYVGGRPLPTRSRRRRPSVAHFLVKLTSPGTEEIRHASIRNRRRDADCGAAIRAVLCGVREGQDGDLQVRRR